MEIRINSENEIVGYARVGHISGAFEISIEELPDGFFENYQPQFYKYDELYGIIENQNYKPPRNLETIESSKEIRNLYEANTRIKYLEEENNQIKKDFDDLKTKIDKIIQLEA